MSKRKLQKIAKQLKGSSKMHGAQAKTIEKMVSSKEKLREDLRKWVKEKWVDIGAPKKGGGFKPCGRSEGEKRSGYPKCVPSAKASSMSKKARKSAVRRKRAAGNTGPKPKNVKTDMNEGKLCPKGKERKQKLLRRWSPPRKNFVKIYASGSKRSGLTLEPPRRVVDLNRVDGLRVRREVGILSVYPLPRLPV